MANNISPLSHVHPNARIGNDVTIGPFCLIDENVELGDRCVLDSHVTLTGHTTIGTDNRFFPNSVIGGEPQDSAYVESPTRVVIGNHNVFREGVTVHRGAEKEDHTTWIGDNNAFFANAHVAHNCRVFNNVILVNGVLLGGHVHVQDRAIISGNTVVHHFTTVGTLAFISGGGRVVRDVPPYMLGAGNDNFSIKTVNTVGMQRSGISKETILIVKKACRLLIKRNMEPAAIRTQLASENETLPPELDTLLDAAEYTRQGKSGRGREQLRDVPDTPPGETKVRKAA
jgi:UDP-N-acetylglucosamine acyltransferase